MRLKQQLTSTSVSTYGVLTVQESRPSSGTAQYTHVNGLLLRYVV
jgi:hypothetical protein